MKLQLISISRFRSIRDANKIGIGSYTVLVGANNVGKSNVLRALNVGMKAISKGAHPSGISPRSYRATINPYRTFSDEYNWERDFPLDMKDRKNGQKDTRIRIDFILTDDEIREFNSLTKININNPLPLEITIGPTNNFDIKVKKQGTAGSQLNRLISDVCKFVDDRIFINYIPSIRTKGESARIVRYMLERRLRDLESDPNYINAIESIRQVQQPYLETLGDELSTMLKVYVPNVKAVKIESESESLRRAVAREPVIVIDDGTATNLEHKGDGIQSLVALGLFQTKQQPGKMCVYAVEEPESHLHSGAVHELKSEIRKLALDSQVIVTTHSPIFVDHDAVNSVVLIDSGKSFKAKNIDSVRSALGVRVSDNMKGAEFIIFTEGETDKAIIKKMLSIDSQIDRLLSSGRIVIQSMNGGTNISYHASSATTDVVDFHFVVDDDPSGHSGIDKARKDRLIQEYNYTVIRKPSNKESEIEDIVNPKIYAKAFSDTFGVDINETHFQSNKKWSDKMKNGFEKSGKVWDEQNKRKAKRIVSQLVESNPSDSILPFSNSSRDTIMKHIRRSFNVS